MICAVWEADRLIADISGCHADPPGAEFRYIHRDRGACVLTACETVTGISGQRAPCTSYMATARCGEQDPMFYTLCIHGSLKQTMSLTLYAFTSTQGALQNAESGYVPGSLLRTILFKAADKAGRHAMHSGKTRQCISSKATHYPTRGLRERGLRLQVIGRT